MNYVQGDIVFVNYPFTDQQAAKQRPALIISKEEDNKLLLTMLKITSVTKLDKYSYPISDSMFSAPKPSEIRLNEPMTISKSCIQRRIGHLNSDEMERIIDLFKAFY